MFAGYAGKMRQYVEIVMIKCVQPQCQLASEAKTGVHG